MSNEQQSEPPLEDLAIEAANYLDALNLVESRHLAFALRARGNSSRAPLAAVEGDATLDGLRALLNRYAQPCDENCDHSQCPLLRELHALHIKRTLERAQQTVKPIIDHERKGEFMGDLMNVQLTNMLPVVSLEQVDGPEILASQIVQGCSNWSDIQHKIVPRIVTLLRSLSEPPAAAASSAPAERPQGDGWVTFGRVKVDIENETETFERIPVTAEPLQPEGEQEPTK